MGNFVAQYPSWRFVAATLLVHSCVLWLPAALNFFRIGNQRLYQAQARLAVVATVALLVGVSTYEFSLSYFALVAATINWILLVLAYIHAAKSQSTP